MSVHVKTVPIGGKEFIECYVGNSPTFPLYVPVDMIWRVVPRTFSNIPQIVQDAAGGQPNDPWWQFQLVESATSSSGLRDYYAPALT